MVKYVVCVSRIDLIVIEIDSNAQRLTQLSWSKNWLDPISTQSCATLYSIYWLFTDSTSFKSILQQSNRSFSNRVNSLTPTISPHNLVFCKTTVITLPTGQDISIDGAHPNLTLSLWEETGLEITGVAQKSRRSISSKPTTTLWDVTHKTALFSFRPWCYVFSSKDKVMLVKCLVMTVVWLSFLCKSKEWNAGKRNWYKICFLIDRRYYNYSILWIT